MKLGVTVLLFLAFILAGTQPPNARESSCPSTIKNSAPLLQPGAVILLGEMHGTQESPLFLRDLVCLALEQDLAVTVGLEIPDAETPRLEAYLASEGDSAAVAHLVAGDFWHRPAQDGRSSAVMLRLIEGFRFTRTYGAPLNVLYLDAAATVNRDSVMATRLYNAIQEAPSDVFITLTGNIHNRLTVGTQWNAAYEPMGYLLLRTLFNHPIYALDVAYTGGEAWVCFGSQASDCGVQQLKGNAEQGDGIVVDDENPAYSGRYYVNTLTASRPIFEPGDSQ
ncbi:MAG TPA: hypothetical protein VKP65_01545 [Rhodothermales bacterium]|nr:hypothetical protein [Rhodothermales bacterium]